MKKYIPTVLKHLTFLGICTGIASAQISIETDGTNAANLTKITVDGTEYTSFIGATVTQFSMYGDNGRTTQIYASGSSPLVGTDAPTVLEDSSLTSAYTALRSLAFDFDSAVVNQAGADIFLFEFNPAETSYLTLNITINGTTINYGSSGNPFVDTGSTGTYRLSQSPYLDTASTLQELIDIPSFTTYGSESSGAIAYLAIDLTDFGIADNATISSISIAGTTVGDGQYDISGLVAVPEPRSLALMLGLFGLSMIALRHRNRS
ncbi:hypothetical protein [Coraliomargarita parva]|uniref:hypothetical protein n=1 Tax=Coraliomargarita parva TaxID=3014050 RepID=UPI0022B36B77|nr:hypothetical protein [Coraliomargarita parva]